MTFREKIICGGAALLLAAPPIFASSLIRDGVAGVVRETVHVAHVIDGDTFNDDKGVSYRLVGINAPEIAHPTHGRRHPTVPSAGAAHGRASRAPGDEDGRIPSEESKPEGEPGGVEAEDALKAMIDGQDVQVVWSDKDHYGRTVALVFTTELGEDEPANLVMAREGFADLRYLKLAPAWFDSEAFAAQVAGAPSGGSTNTRACYAAPEDSGSPLPMKDGDKVFITVGDQDQAFVISTVGSIYVKGLGEFVVRGLTTAQAKEKFGAALRAKGITAEFDLHFTPSIPPPPKVSVVGAIQRPGEYAAKTLISALTLAAVNSDLVEDATVRDTAHIIATVNIKKLFLGEVQDVTLPPGAIVYISSTVTPRWVTVYGEVNKPGPVQAITALNAIGAAFGLKENAAKNRIQIHDPDGTSQKFDYDKAALGDAPDIRMVAGATIFVSNKNTVLVSGQVARPQWVYADSAREALKNVGWPLPNAFVSHATFKTANGDTRDVDLTGVMNGVEDFQVGLGDELSIPAHSVPPVSVFGWVETPGTYTESTVIGSVRKALIKEGALKTVRVWREADADTTDSPAPKGESASEIVPIDSLKDAPKFAMRIEVLHSPLIQLVGAVHKPGPYFASTVSELLTLAHGATPDAEITDLAFYDTAGRAVPLPAGGMFPYDGTVRVPTTGAAFGPIDNADSMVVVTGFGVHTSVLKADDLRKTLLRAGYEVGKSNITLRVYRSDPRTDNRFAREKGRKVFMLDVEKVINGRLAFNLHPGDSVFLEEKTDPFAFFLKMLGFAKSVKSGGATFITTGP